MDKAPHSDMSQEELIDEVVKANLDISISLQRVLKGFIQEMRGPEHFGEELAKLAKDDTVSISSRVSIMNNMSKLMGQYSGKSNDDELEDEEQLQAFLDQVDSARH